MKKNTKHISAFAPGQIITRGEPALKTKCKLNKNLGVMVQQTTEEIDWFMGEAVRYLGIEHNMIILSKLYYSDTTLHSKHKIEQVPYS